MSQVDASGSPRLPLLYVDDEESNLQLFRLAFADDYHVQTSSSGAEALRRIEEQEIGLILTDERMPGMSGIELLERVVQRWPDTVRVIVSAYSDADRLLRAINRGHAHEYVLKPWDRDDLQGCLDRGLAMLQRRRHLASRASAADALAQDLHQPCDPSGMVGSTGGLAETLHTALRAASSQATLLLRGETGTGKELLARAIHAASPRSHSPFVAVNSAALSEGVLESELFGHERGAYTGAHQTRAGRFEMADGGTLFLDEIGDITPRMQVALLRVLQEGEFLRVGGRVPVKVDVRVIAATHRDLEARVTAGRFREDLFYRLNVIPLTIPPLRERREDIDALVEHFVSKHAPADAPSKPVDSDALVALRAYDWPGNVRELENVVHRAVVLSVGDTLSLEDFCLDLRQPDTPSIAPPTTDNDVRAEARRCDAAALRRLLLQHGGNFARAARALDIPRTTLVSRAKKFGIL